MKNIYEDAEGRNAQEDITGGQNGFSGNGSVNEPPSSVQRPTRPMPLNDQPAASSQAPIQLSQEQLTQLIAQIVSAQQNAGMQQAQPVVEEITIKADEAKPTVNDTSDPGKRILYQSEDFDEKQENKLLPTLSASGLDSEAIKRSFYDDDVLFDNEYISTRTLNGAMNGTSGVKITDFGEQFSIAEVELSDSELPDLPPTRIIKGKPMASAPSTTAAAKKPTVKVPPAPKKAPEGSIYDVDVEEVSLNDSISSIEETSKPQQVQPKKKVSTGEIIRRAVLAISIVAIVVASGVLVREYMLHKQNLEDEANFSDLIVSEVETAPSTTKKKAKKGSKSKENKKTTAKATTATTAPETTVLTEQQQWDAIRAEYPNAIFPPNLQLKYAKFYATNNDFVGFLSAEGINLNLPIVQTTDDEKYLTKNFYGKTTKYGCPFVTHTNNITELDKNTVIFGHHMNDGTVFGALDKYKSIEGFKKAPVISFNTLYKDYDWKVIAAFITNAYDKDDNGFVFQYYFNNLSKEESFAAFLNELAQRSLYDTGVDVLPSDKILTLSTCSHEFEDARFVVVARLVRSGESTDVATQNAVVNSNPRYPQAYYTKKRRDNPYLNASKWYVE